MMFVSFWLWRYLRTYLFKSKINYFHACLYCLIIIYWNSRIILTIAHLVLSHFYGFVCDSDGFSLDVRSVCYFLRDLVGKKGPIFTDLPSSFPLLWVQLFSVLFVAIIYRSILGSAGNIYSLLSFVLFSLIFRIPSLSFM